MKNKLMSAFTGMAIAFFATVLPAVAQDCVAQGGIVVHPGQGVEFSQVTYTFEGVVATVGIKPSGTGAVHIDVAELQKMMSGGFVNVVTEAGWVTQNVPILSRDTDPYNLSATLNLSVPTGTAVSSLKATVCYSSQPLSHISSASFDRFPVRSSEYAGEGIGDAGIDFIPPPPEIDHIRFEQQGRLDGYRQPFHSWQNTDVQAASAQCAPAAAANSPAWLKIRWDVPIPDANRPGLRDRVRNSLVGALDMDMQTADPRTPRNCSGNMPGRWAVDRATGIGTPAISQVKGTMQYLSDHNILNLTLKHQGLSTATCDGFTGGNDVHFRGLVSTGQGVKVDPDFIINEVVNDSAVEYDAVYYNRLGQPAGGHAMVIIGAGSTNGRAWIEFVSDHVQTACGGLRYPFFPYGCRGPFLYDNVGTRNNQGQMIVDFSYLDTSDNQQPRLSGGYMPGSYAVAVLTQHP